MKITLRARLLLVTAMIAATFSFSAIGGYENFANPDDWNFIITPYVLLPSQNGKITIKGGTTDLDTSVADSARNFDFGGQFYAEARKGKWGIFTDTTFAQSSSDSGNVDVTTQFIQSDFGLLYRFLDRPLGGSGAGQGSGRVLTLDAIVGGRYLSLHNDADIRIQSGYKLNVVESMDWVDPIVGARLMADLTDRLMLIVRGDVGGFGGSTDQMWSLSTYVGYELWEQRFLMMGYRFLDVQYEEGRGSDLFRYDALSQGPVVGFVFRF